MNILFAVIKNSKNYKIVMATVLLVFVFLAGFTYEIYHSYRSEIDRAKVETANLSWVLKEQINGVFSNIDYMLQELQGIVEVERQNQTFTSESLNKILFKRRLRLSFVKSFKIIDKDANFIADDEGIKKNLNLRDREYYQYLKSTNTNELVISKPVISKTSKVWVIVAARRLVNKKGEFDGVILGTIPLTYFKQQFEKLNLGSYGVVGLFDMNFAVHARIPWVDEIMGNRYKISEGLRHFFESDDIIYVTEAISPVDSISRLTAIRKLEAFPFVVVVGLSRSDVTTDWRNRTILYGTFIVLIFSSFLYFLVIFLKSQDDLEEQRHQAIQASKLSSLGEMASGIAHEINNPLTIISALATRTKKNLKQETYSRETALENQDKIISTVNRIAKIIRGLRSFSRDSNGDEFSRKKVSEIIEMTLDLCQERLKDKGIEITVEAIVDAEMECREIQIVQVLVNLFNNSLDAVSTLNEKWINLSTWEEDNKIFIRITDSGSGIAEEISEKMMIPFFTTKEIGKGTGLGLSISKGIIEAHHGHFYYEKFKRSYEFYYRTQ